MKSVKVGRGIEFENRKIGHLTLIMTPNQTQGIGDRKYPRYVDCSTAVPNFRPLGSTISRFQDIAHFKILPFTPVLTQIFNFWQIAKACITFIPHVYLI